MVRSAHDVAELISEKIRRDNERKKHELQQYRRRSQPVTRDELLLALETMGGRLPDAAALLLKAKWGID